MEELYRPKLSIDLLLNTCKVCTGINQISLTAQLSCNNRQRRCTGPQSLLLIATSWRQKKHARCTLRIGATQRLLLRHFSALIQLTSCNPCCYSVIRANMAADANIRLLLERGESAGIVKEKEKYLQQLSKSFRKINKKKNEYRGRHLRDLLAEALIPRWKVDQYFSTEPIALK